MGLVLCNSYLYYLLLSYTYWVLLSVPVENSAKDFIYSTYLASFHWNVGDRWCKNARVAHPEPSPSNCSGCSAVVFVVVRMDVVQQVHLYVSGKYRKVPGWQPYLGKTDWHSYVLCKNIYYVCMCIYIYIIHVWLFACVCVCTWCAYFCIGLCTHGYTDVCVCLFVSMYACMYVYTGRYVGSDQVCIVVCR